MASGVSVESAAIQGGIGCCKTSIHELESASRSLQRSYQQAGSGGWKDQKYAALGGIVEECCSSMKKDISNTIRDIERISSGIKSGMSATSNWDDAQAAQFNMLMQQIARLTATPIDTLNSALPKLEKLAQSLDQYNKVKF